jgi:ABC-type spermidine/putrescine transport system permease subunit II
MPGVISGALFAFVTSFDEVVVVLFLAGLENTHHSNSNVGWIKRTIKPNYFGSSNMFNCNVYFNSRLVQSF